MSNYGPSGQDIPWADCGPKTEKQLRQEAMTRLRAELKQVRAMHDRATDVIATSEETRIALQRELEQVRGERDEALDQAAYNLQQWHVVSHAADELLLECGFSPLRAAMRSVAPEAVMSDKRVHALLTENLALRDAVSDAHEYVCSALCPSVKPTGTEWRHHAACQGISRVLAESPLTAAAAERVKAMERVWHTLNSIEDETDGVCPMCGSEWGCNIDCTFCTLAALAALDAKGEV